MSPKFQIRYSRSNRIAGLHLIGRIGLDERLQAARQLALRFRHLAHLRLLLVDARYAHSTMTAEELADFVCAHPVLCRARIAVLFSSRFSPSLGALQNMVSVSRRRGGFFWPKVKRWRGSIDRLSVTAVRGWRVLPRRFATIGQIYLSVRFFQLRGRFILF